MTSSSHIHYFNTSAKMISPCGHPKETSPARPLLKVHRQWQRLHQEFGALVDWTRIAGRDGEETRGGWNATFFVSGKLRGGSDRRRYVKINELLHFVEGGNTALVAPKPPRQCTHGQDNKECKEQKPRTHIGEQYSDPLLPPSPRFHRAVNASLARQRKKNVHGAYLRVLTGQSRAAGSSMRRGEAASLRSVLHHAQNQGREKKKKGEKTPRSSPSH